MTATAWRVTLQELCTLFEQFDADGESNIDIKEFRSMMSTSRDATILFAGFSIWQSCFSEMM
jgi:Ca2+-binding EF-hand superfamily protein